MADNSFLGTDILPDYTPTSDEKTMALLAHILTLVSALLAPLIIYIVKKDESKFVAAHAKESFNFQLTIILIYIGFSITGIGLFFLWVPWLLSIALSIVATIRASEGKLCKYPFSIKFIQ